jgi:hypothetical protein
MSRFLLAHALGALMHTRAAMSRTKPTTSLQWWISAQGDNLAVTLVVGKRGVLAQQDHPLSYFS